MNKKLDLLLATSQLFISTLDLKQATNLILKKVRETLNVERASLMLIDEKEPDCLKIEDAVGIDEEIIEHVRVKIGEDIAGYVVKEGKPLLVDDVNKDKRFTIKPWSEKYKTKSFLIVPLKIKDKIIGVINVNDKITREKFTLSDQKLLTAIAAQAAIAIENARLVKEIINKERDKERVKNLFSSYVSPYVVDEILKEDVKAFTNRREVVTILFADIRDFGTLSEKLQPEEVVGILNDFFTEMSNSVDKYDGIVNKFLGDGILAFFGGPISHKEGELTDSMRALLSGLEMQEKFSKLLDKWQKSGSMKLDIGLGIGIHTGEVIVGNIGSEKRREYTIIGSNVITASRLCDIAAANEILISDVIYQELKDRIVAELKDELPKMDKSHYKIYKVKKIYDIETLNTKKSTRAPAE